MCTKCKSSYTMTWQVQHIDSRKLAWHKNKTWPCERRKTWLDNQEREIRSLEMIQFASACFWKRNWSYNENLGTYKVTCCYDESLDHRFNKAHVVSAVPSHDDKLGTSLANEVLLEVLTRLFTHFDSGGTTATKPFFHRTSDYIVTQNVVNKLLSSNQSI